MRPPETAPYACRPEHSRGRRVAEPDSPARSCFQRDRDRIIHCGAFRRLKYKTQVFVYHEGDYYRTRLSHSIEVAQIARSIARALALNEDLAEVAPFGGFDHNEQTFRVLTLLERRYAEFDGLNLTWEALEGTVKHNGPLAGPRAREGPVPATIARFCEAFDLELDSYAGAEAQVAALADDIAYNSHDIDDGLRAGLFGIDDLTGLPLVGPVVAELLAAYPGIEHGRLVHETVRRVIDRMVTDLLDETGRRLAEAAPESPDALRALGAPVVAFSGAMREKDRALKAFLFERMYRHYRVNRMGSKVRRVVRDLFEHYLAEPDCLPDEWRDQAAGAEATARARLVADYIAGMTDRYALEEHHKLFDIYTKT
jgi:dGTPase